MTFLPCQDYIDSVVAFCSFLHCISGYNGHSQLLSVSFVDASYIVHIGLVNGNDIPSDQYYSLWVVRCMDTKVICTCTCFMCA